MLPFLYGPGAQTEGVCIAWLSVRDVPLNQATKGTHAFRVGTAVICRGHPRALSR